MIFTTNGVGRIGYPHANLKNLKKENLHFNLPPYTKLKTTKLLEENITGLCKKFLHMTLNSQSIDFKKSIHWNSSKIICSVEVLSYKNDHTIFKLRENISNP
jgi:hypothetical protein